MEYASFEILRTLVLLVAFIAIVFWAWSSKRKKAFDEAARLPLRDNNKPIAEEDRNE